MSSDHPCSGCEFWPHRGSCIEIIHRSRPLEANGPIRLIRLTEVSRHPAGRVEAHGRFANERGQVRLEALELGGTNLPLPLVAQLVEDRFTGAQHVEAEFGDLKAFAAGV